MPVDASFLRVAGESFDPYTPDSGTEHIAMLLYSLARMLRVRTVVERGAGYTTLFLLRALADNLSDFRDEERALREKAASLNAAHSGAHQGGDPRQPLFAMFFEHKGKACGVDPAFYLKPYLPRLFSFESHPPEHPYSRAVTEAVRRVGHEELFVQINGPLCSPTLLPSQALPVDLAWNDDQDYQGFFGEFWEKLNPSGGLLVFHNVPAVKEWWDAVEWMRKQRAPANDLEVLILQEPHKLNQNGCAILRRVTSYKPSFVVNDSTRMLSSLSRFMTR